MPPGEKKLVILDLDETLIHSRVELLDHPCDLEINPLYVYVRPHAEKLIKAFAERFSIAVWSAGSPKYVRRITEHLLEGLDPVVEPVFVWDRDACSKKASVPDFAIVPRVSASSSRDIPMPLSATDKVLFFLSTLNIILKFPSDRELSVSDA